MTNNNNNNTQQTTPIAQTNQITNINPKMFGVKYRIYPTKTQLKYLHQQFGGVRYLHNKIISYVKAQNKNHNVHQCVASKQWSYKTYKKNNPQEPWLKDIIASAVNQELRAIQGGYDAYSKKVKGEPKYKSKNNDRDSFTIQVQHCTTDTTNGTIVIDWTRNRIKFPLPRSPYIRIIKEKELWFKARLHRKFQNTNWRICYATISRDNNEYYISFNIQRDKDPDHMPLTHQSVGIDLGIKDDKVVVESNGTKHQCPDMKKLQKKLNRLNRKFSRQQSTNKIINGVEVVVHSSNKMKTLRRIRALYSRAKHLRQEFIHTLTHDLVQKYDIIGMEDLDIANLLRNKSKNKKNTSNTNTANNTTKIKSKKSSKTPVAKMRKGMHRKIANASWGEIERCLKYKCVWYGKEDLRYVPRNYASTQICNNCGTKCGPKGRENLDKRHWRCKKCNTVHDRDINAAKNICDYVTSPNYVPPQKPTNKNGKKSNANKTVKPTIKVKSANVSTKTKGRKTKTTNTNN